MTRSVYLFPDSIPEHECVDLDDLRAVAAFSDEVHELQPCAECVRGIANALCHERTGYDALEKRLGVAESERAEMAAKLCALGQHKWAVSEWLDQDALAKRLIAGGGLAHACVWCRVKRPAQ